MHWITACILGLQTGFHWHDASEEFGPKDWGREWLYHASLLRAWEAQHGILVEMTGWTEARFWLLGVLLWHSFLNSEITNIINSWACRLDCRVKCLSPFHNGSIRVHTQHHVALGAHNNSRWPASMVLTSRLLASMVLTFRLSCFILTLLIFSIPSVPRDVFRVWLHHRS